MDHSPGFNWFGWTALLFATIPLAWLISLIINLFLSNE